MKKYCKILSLAIASAFLLQSFVPVSVYAEADASTEAMADGQVAEDTVVTEAVIPETEVTPIEDVVIEHTEDVADDSILDTVGVPADEAAVVEPVETASEAVAQDVLVDAKEETEKTEESEESEETEESEEIDLDKLELIEPEDGKDFNSDGVSDLMTKLLCDGEILTADGNKVFGGYSYLDVQKTNDLDGDNLLNGDEFVIKTDDNGKEYAELLSDPTKLDTDEDGINDADDTAPFEYGLAGGVVGSVRLVARHDESTGNPTHGHVYIVYTSYVNNLTISIDDLYGYYLTNPQYQAQLKAAAEGDNAQVVSWRSTVNEITDANASDREAAASEMFVPQEHELHTAGSVVLNRGDYVSIGNYGMATTQEVVADYVKQAEVLFKDNYDELVKLWNAATGENRDEQYVKDHFYEVIMHLGQSSQIMVDSVLKGKTPGGVFINRELYNQKFGYDQGPNEVIEQDITADQTKTMMDYFGKESSFNMMSHNCTTVGAGAWNAVFGFKTSDDGQVVASDYYVNPGFNVLGYQFDFPVVVKNVIKNMSNLSGYIGPMTYVTGKAVTNTVNTSVTTFDIIKLFREKVVPVVPTPTPAGPTVTPANPSNGGNNGSSTSVNNTTTGATIDFASMISPTLTAATNMLIQDDAVPAAAVSTRRARRSVASATGRRSGADAEEEVEEEEVPEEEPEVEDTTEIEDEDTPLAVEEEVKTGFPWMIIAIIIGACAVAAVVTVSIKKRAK